MNPVAASLVSKGSLELPDLDVGVGRVFCLHVPYDFPGEIADLKLRLASTVKKKGSKVVVSSPAYDTRWFRRFRREETPIDWLIRNARVSKIKAEISIRNLQRADIQASKPLSHHPGTSRALLGICAALEMHPDVLIYSAEALDLSGTRDVHNLVSRHGDSLCAVHISLPHFHGDGKPAERICPSKGECLDLA